MFRAVFGAIKRTIIRVADASVFRATRNDDVQSAVRGERKSPGKRLFLSDPLVLQRPCLAAICALVNASSEPGNIQDTGVLGTSGIEQDMRWRSLIHSGARLAPRFTSVIADADSTLILRRILMTPHFRTRQVMRITVHPPQAAAHLRIKGQPVCSVDPIARDAGGRTLPA